LGIGFARLNLGNMHTAAGKDRYSCTIALDQGDIDNLRQMAVQGVSIVSQCIPADREQGWEQLLRGRDG
jgi:PTS system mannose-specific IIB component